MPVCVCVCVCVYLSVPANSLRADNSQSVSSPLWKADILPFVFRQAILLAESAPGSNDDRSPTYFKDQVAGPDLGVPEQCRVVSCRAKCRVSVLLWSEV